MEAVVGGLEHEGVAGTDESVIVDEQQPEAMEVILRRAVESDAAVARAGRYLWRERARAHFVRTDDAAARALDVPSVAVYQTDVAGFAAAYRLGLVTRAAWGYTRGLHELCDRTLAPSTAAMR